MRIENELAFVERGGKRLSKYMNYVAKEEPTTF